MVIFYVHLHQRLSGESRPSLSVTLARQRVTQATSRPSFTSPSPFNTPRLIFLDEDGAASHI
ncbi:hypothetical protein E2C01_044417 [Portunus trituberculatus]|uniref:Uncharacterized protein n=1 Tax=Portunus trituberculatus TaxID=210409 RepID=A0A5B7G0E4_PORTR|nr:hypothetical protein [Portunus trituberculatus]